MRHVVVPEHLTTHAKDIVNGISAHSVVQTVSGVRSHSLRTAIDQAAPLFDTNSLTQLRAINTRAGRAKHRVPVFPPAPGADPHPQAADKRVLQLDVLLPRHLPQPEGGLTHALAYGMLALSHAMQILMQYMRVPTLVPLGLCDGGGDFRQVANFIANLNEHVYTDVESEMDTFVATGEQAFAQALRLLPHIRRAWKLHLLRIPLLQGIIFFTKTPPDTLLQLVVSVTMLLTVVYTSAPTPLHVALQRSLMVLKTVPLPPQVVSLCMLNNLPLLIVFLTSALPPLREAFRPTLKVFKIASLLLLSTLHCNLMVLQSAPLSLQVAPLCMPNNFILLNAALTSALLPLPVAFLRNLMVPEVPLPLLGAPVCMLLNLMLLTVFLTPAPLPPWVALLRNVIVVKPVPLKLAMEMVTTRIPRLGSVSWLHAYRAHHINL
ncbi:unnamed protein product [Prorocentrum cordatum]|uniref:Uncharacterized protein n=1 Tax=Prorocentrum cordatum TaxID=2364126 RepID=A0ABN9SC82_9DINO|nr:unnamed protein product [Polarella glacialis]